MQTGEVDKTFGYNTILVSNFELFVERRNQQRSSVAAVPGTGLAR